MRCKLACNCRGFLQMSVLQGTLISPNEIRQSTWSALPRRNSICGKQSAAEYTQISMQCKLVCTSNGFSQMCGPQGTLISPNRYGQARGSAMPRRYSICGKQSAAEYTQISMQCKLVCTSNGFSQMSGPQGTLISPNMLRPGNRMLLCRGATVYAASTAQTNIRGFRCDASLLATAEDSCR